MKAGAGFWDKGAASIGFNYCGNNDAWEDVNATGEAERSLGNISKLYLKGWWFKTWRNTDDLNWVGELHYMVYPVGQRPQPEAWVILGKNYDENLTKDGNGWPTNVLFGGSNLNINLVDGLAEGEYVLEYFYKGSFKNGTNEYLSNDSQNYKINFHYYTGTTSCFYTTAQGASQIAISWQTKVNGDVVINLLDYGKADNVVFRNDGIENMNALKVLSGDGFSVEEDASNYFTRSFTSKEILLTKKAELPTPCKIRFRSSAGALAWKAGADDRWNSEIDFTYTYGTHCQSVAAPTGVAVTSAGRVSFNDVAGATGYFANIYDGAELVSTQAITNGGLLQFITSKTSYTVKVIAAIGDFGSEESEAATWTTYAHHVFGVSDLNNYTYNGFKDGNSQVALTANTNSNGDVVITISNVSGDAPVLFRDGALTASKFNVYFGEDFAENAPATAYFDISKNDAKTSVVLSRKENVLLPYPCIIKFDAEGNGALEWTANGVGKYTRPKFQYTYGTTCRVNEGMPGNVSVSTMGRVRHDDVVGAEKYAAVVIKDGAIVLQQDITSGAPLNWIPTVSGTYKVTVIAFDADGNMFDVPAEADWSVEAGHVYGATNIFVKDCGTGVSSNGYNGSPAYFTWETLANGNVVITMTDAEGNLNADYHFRGTTGFNAGSFALNGDMDAFTAAFSCDGNKNEGQTFVLKLNGAKPASGSIISYSKDNIEYSVPGATGAWPNLSFSYVYGTGRYPKENTKPVISSFTGESNDYTTATLNVVASDKDDDNLEQTILTYTLSGDKGFVTTEVTPVAGVIELTDLTKNTIYNFTLTVTDPSGNSAQESVEVKMKWDASENLAFKKPTETSHYQGDGVKSPKAVDGDEGTFWTSYGGGEATPQWWTVDMGELYAISRVRILFNDHAGKYNVLYSADGTEWHTYLADFSIDNAHVDYTINQVASVRYFKFTTTNSNVGIKEFEVYGTGYASADATAPVVTATEVAESATTTSVKLHIVATDEDDNHAAQPTPALAISGDNGFATIENVELDGKGNILIEGLKNCMKSYTFRVTATDLAGNSSFTDVVVKLPFDLEFDLTEYATAEMVCAGYSNGGDSPIEAVQELGHWGTWGISGTDEEKLAKNWWAIDLGDVIKIHHINIDFEATAKYNIEASFSSIEEIKNGTAEWFVVVDNAEAGDHDYTEMSFAARSIRVKARSTNNIGIERIKIYGTGFTAPDTKEPVIAAFSKTAVTTTTATFHVEATDINDAGEPQHITYMLSGDHEFAAVEVTPDEEGNFTIEKLHPNYVYQFQLTAIDEAANSTLSESVEVVLTWDNDYNLALDGEATDGYHEGTYTAAKAIDGSSEAASKWNTWNVWDDPHTYADNWMQVKLEDTYNLTKVVVDFAHAAKNYSILGSLDGENWYLIAKEENENRSAQTDEVLVSAPAKYVRFVGEGTIQEDYVGIYEFQIYASGFAAIEDSKPEITIARQESLSDVEVSFLVDAMDVTTHPITTYVVTGIGAEQVVSPVDHKLTFTVTPNTHYNVSIKAKDAEGNLSAAKAFEFTSEGSGAGLYLFSDLWGWSQTPNAGQFTTTDVDGVESMSYTNTTAADKAITYKMWNADADRATFGDKSGTTDHALTIPAGETVTFYATSEDQFLSTLDDIYIVGSLVGEEKQLEWNADHTVGIWRGTINLEGDKKFNLTKKSGSHSYTKDFYAEAQTFVGDYTRAVFTLDLKHMTGTWSQLEMVILDQAADNTGAIDNHDGQNVDVTLERRFIADGYWYTLCLPFDLSAEQLAEAYGEDYDLRYLASSYMKGSDVLFLNFEKATELQAGMPYMFKPSGVEYEEYGTNDDPTIFRNVKIDTKTPEHETAVATMYGYYSPKIIDAPYYVLGTDDYLYHTDGTLSNAFRCYFQLNPSTSAPVRARVVFGSQVTTGMEELENSEETQKVIRNGQLYIIRDGKIYTTQGLLVK